MTTAVSTSLGLMKQSVRDFINDDCPAMAAALSYYTIFSLPPLLVLILLLVGALLDPQDVQGTIEAQIRGLMGPAGGAQVRTILEAADRPHGGAIATILGVGALLLGASGAFGQLQAALNRSWQVAPDPRQGGIKSFVLKRVFSFGIILVLAFMLLVSLTLSAALSAFGSALTAMLPEGLSQPVLEGINSLLSFGVIVLLFAAIFKVLPDARIAWRDVWVGAIVTALLFMIGKFLIGFYLGRSNPGNAFGAAGSLALMLVWIYYSSMILLFGAEFTQTWAERQGGSGIVPERGAMRVKPESL